MLRNRRTFGSARLAFAVGCSLLTALFVAAALSASAGASNPPSSSITLSGAAGQNEVRTYTGTIPPGANPTSTCHGFENTPLVDVHTLNLTVPAGAYSTIDALYTFSISWNPAFFSATTQDEILTVIGPDPNPGNNVREGDEQESSDGGSPAERIVLQNLPSGQYHVLACPFAAAAAQPYNGRIEVRTTAKAAEVIPPTADAQGLEFSAAVPADNQRDEAEPLIEIDREGFIYTCGPTGFSMGVDYAQVSTDDGDQFHLLGTPPRGEKGGGGGDCSMATGLTRNTQGRYQFAETGLGPLTGFNTNTSPNNGRTIFSAGPAGNGLPGTVPTGGQTGLNPGFLVDRQWQTFIDPLKNRTACTPIVTVPVPGFGEGCVLLNYNELAPRRVVVQRSANGGLTYEPVGSDATPPNPRFPGQIRYIEDKSTVNFAARNTVYFPWDYIDANGNSEIRLSISKDGGFTWTNCLLATPPSPPPPFVIADHDTQGNIYIVYGEEFQFNTYMVVLPAGNINRCNQPITEAPAKRNPGTSEPVRVNRGNVRTTVFPWLTAGGPGRVAITFYGAEQDGNPNEGCNPANTADPGYCADWHVYVNQSLNALSSTRTFSQVRATTHPFHYDSICTNGLACQVAVPPGDRSLADFFAIDFNPASGRTLVTFNRAEKRPNDVEGFVANPMVFTQIAGPRLDTGQLLTRDAPRAALRTSAGGVGPGNTEPSGDAIFPYSLVNVPNAFGQNIAAGDFLEARVEPERNLATNQAVTTNPGFTVTLRLADLSQAALTNAMVASQSASLLWIFRYVDGWQAAAASARYSPATGWSFRWNDYRTGVTPCAGGPGSPNLVQPKCVIYPGDGGPIQGTVDQLTGTIRMSVPRALLDELGPDDQFGRPTEIGATGDARFYDATAFSLANPEPGSAAEPGVQSFLNVFDNTRAFDFNLRFETAAEPTAPPGPADPAVILTKTGPATAARGATITYELAYRNLGPNPSSNARVIDTLPPGVTFVSATGGMSRSYSSWTRKVTWNLGTVPVGGSGTLGLTVRLPTNATVGSTITNKADFTAPLTVSPPTAVWTTTITG